MGSHEFEGNRTIPLWTTAPRTITSLLIAPKMICPGQLLHMPIAGRLPLVPIAPPQAIDPCANSLLSQLPPSIQLPTIRQVS